jgi:hypothetical protein
VPPSQADADRWTADLIQLDGRLLARNLADKQKSGEKVWIMDDFAPGDFAQVHGTWFEIVRVNRKTLTVPWMIGGVTRGIHTVADARKRFPNDKRISTDTVPYDKVQAAHQPRTSTRRSLRPKPSSGQTIQAHRARTAERPPGRASWKAGAGRLHRHQPHPLKTLSAAPDPR